MVIPPEAVGIILNEPVSAFAARAQATYLLGAQPEYFDALWEAGIQLAEVEMAVRQDPANPAEASWNLSIREHLRFLRTHNLPHTPERFLSIVSAAIYIADNDLLQVTGEHVPMHVPKLYREHMPKTYGHVALLTAA